MTPPQACPAAGPITPSSTTVAASSTLSHSSRPPLPLFIGGLPPTGAKSRVETQVKLTLGLPPPPSAPAGQPQPQPYTHLRLPRGTATKRKSRKQSLAEPTVDPRPELVLWLDTEVYCATEGVAEGSPKGTLGTRVYACASCKTREVKRSQRKLAARVKPSKSDSSDEVDSPFSRGPPTSAAASPGTPGPPPTLEDDRKKIVLFNCSSLMDFAKNEVQLPTRVTCYCRHHREKLGFIIKFTLRNHLGVLISLGFTPPLMITDDHKSSEKSTEAAAKAAAAAAAAVGLPPPQHILGSPAAGEVGGRPPPGPKALIMPSNPPTSASKKLNGSAASLHAVSRAGSLSSYPPSSTNVSSPAASRSHTNGTTSPSTFADLSMLSTPAAGSTPTALPSVFPAIATRGTKRDSMQDGISTGDESSSSSTSSGTTHHHHHRKRTATGGASPYERKSSPAGSSLSGASSVLGTPHFPLHNLAEPALPQMEDRDESEEDFRFSLDPTIGGHGRGRCELSPNSPPAFVSHGGLLGLGDGAQETLGICDPSHLRIELGQSDDLLFSIDDQHSKTQSMVDDVCVATSFHSLSRTYTPQCPSSSSFTTNSDADMSFGPDDGEVEAMSFESLVDYEGGASGQLSPPASTSTESRRETSGSSGTSSDSDSLLGSRLGSHSHWPSIYPSAHNNPNNIQIPFPHPYLLPVAPPPPPLPKPSISRLIANEGPLAGGIDITLLGVNFRQGMQAWFGETQATMTSCWNDGTVVCTVPPGIVAGPVPVVLRLEGRLDSCSAEGGSQLFTYKDGSDKALLELALQIVGLKLTGRIEDAKNVALRILGQGSFATDVPTNISTPTAGTSAPTDSAKKVSTSSEKSAFQRLQSAYDNSIISRPSALKSNFQLPPWSVRSSSTTTAKTDEKEKKEKPRNWAAATAAEAIRLTEREVARYGYHPKKMSKKSYDKMLWLFWLPVLISFALFFLVTQLPTLLVDAKRIGAKLLPFKGLITA